MTGALISKGSAAAGSAGLAVEGGDQLVLEWVPLRTRRNDQRLTAAIGGLGGEERHVPGHPR